ncbi:MAG: hypothetical protein KDA78_12175, partial [Planctomycetaceae bacterium]|nr:hypothetical protein [Planctomycetaceae bacterium]
WLRKLVEGLQDQHIGLVTGNRWYVPSSPKLGTLSCYFWNIFAIPMMNAVEIPWGGSIALRAEDMRPGTLRDHLAHAFGEDSTLATYFRSHNQHVRFLPDLIVLNHDDCGLMQLYNFVVRQYLTVRMNNPRWPRVVLYNMFLGLLMTICLPVAWMFPEFASPIYVGYPILTCSLIMLAIHTQNLVRERVRTNSNKSIFWVTPARFAMFLVAIPVMAILNIMATIQSFFTREHVWRGLRYRFGQNPRVLIVSENTERPRLGSVVAPLAEVTE